MVKRWLRSNKMVKVKRKLPSGRTGVIFRKKKISSSHCAETGEKLKGVIVGRKKDIRNLSKTEKRPTRYYGGVLSVRGLKKRLLKSLGDKYGNRSNSS